MKALKELTKQQKNSFYKEAVSILEKDIHKCICGALMWVVHEKTGEYYYPSHLLIMFPEFNIYKPHGSKKYGYWWPIGNKNIRIAVLTKCIALTT